MNNKSDLKIFAIVSLTILILLFAYNVTPIIQIKFQLVSDFIPASVFYEVAKPFIYISTFYFLSIIIVAILFLRKKYLPVIIFGCVAFILNQIFVHLIMN
ncbi:hypothetical protein ASF92_02785 [Pedobacter sp. Leaf176]|nr:hypothetical protein ASF92_02785 [Pedobacter sp. Leaf176]